MKIPGSTIIGAIPPGEYGGLGGSPRWPVGAVAGLPLPDGWSWWEQDERTMWTDEEPADHRVVIGQVSAQWVVTWRAEALAELASKAVAAWLAGGPGAYEMLRALPPGWYAWAMGRLGYADAQGRPRELFGAGNGAARGQGGSYDDLGRETWAQRSCPEGTEGAILVARPAWEIVVLGPKRLARAAEGTLLPGPAGRTGWRHADLTSDRFDWLARVAPLPMDHAEAAALWSDLAGGPSSDLTTIVVRPTENGRWAAGYGLGSYHRQLGERATRDEAIVLATERLAEHQRLEWARATERAGGRLDWTGWPPFPPDPTIVVADAGENGWDAYRRQTTPS